MASPASSPLGSMRTSPNPFQPTDRVHQSLRLPLLVQEESAASESPRELNELLPHNQEEDADYVKSMELAAQSPRKLKCWGTEHASWRSKLSNRMARPYVGPETLRMRKLRVSRALPAPPRERLGGGKSGKDRGPELMWAKRSPRNMGTSTVFRKSIHSTEENITEKRVQGYGKSFKDDYNIKETLTHELEAIDLSCMDWIQDKVLVSIGIKCPNLISISFQGIANLTDSAIISLRKCLRLRDLDISGCTALSGKSFSESLRSWRHLRSLSMSGCRQIFDCPGYGSQYLSTKWATTFGSTQGKRACKRILLVTYRAGLIIERNKSKSDAVRKREAEKEATMASLQDDDNHTLEKGFQEAGANEEIHNKNVTTKIESLELGICNAIVANPSFALRYCFGHVDISAKGIVAREEAIALVKMLNLPMSLADPFPMPWSKFADLLAYTMASTPKHRIWAEALARHTVGLPPIYASDLSSESEVSKSVLSAILENVPVNYGAVVMQAISSSVMVSLQHLNISNCPGISDSTLAGLQKGPKLGTEYASSWREYNQWVATGKWTSFVLSDKDRLEIAEARASQSQLKNKVAEYKARLDMLSKEMHDAEIALAERPESRRYQKELEKVRKRYSIAQTRIAQSKKKIIDLENEIGNKGSIGHGERRPIPGPRMAIRTLDVSGTCLSDRGFARLAACCPNVFSAKLCYCDSDDLTNKFAKIAYRAWPKLEEIDLAGCSQIGDVAIKTLAKNSEYLTRLIIGGCAVTNEGAKAIGDGCENLLDLDLTGCSGLTDDVLDNIVKCNRSLRTIRVDFCENLSEDFLEELGQREQRVGNSEPWHINILCSRQTHFVRPPPREFIFDPDSAGDGKKAGKGKKGKKKKKKKKG